MDNGAGIGHSHLVATRPDPRDKAVDVRPLDRDVLRLLRAGPFAAALDAVIEARGLSLERIRDHLRAQGITVSRTTLGYWRNGRSRPERGQSLDAVVQLERLLGVPTSSLVTLLGPRRPRGRWLDYPPGTLAWRRLFPSGGPIIDELTVGAGENGFEIITVHDLIVVDDERCERSHRTRLVIEAVADQVDHCLVFFQDDQHRPLPRLAEPRSCRIGRQRVDPVSQLMIAELVLDRRLTAGECTVIEYEFQFPPGILLDNVHRRFNRPVREYVLHVQFGQTIPTRCHRFHQRTPDDAERDMGRMWIGATGAVSLVLHDVRPGISGIRWEW